jgi:hypothetical protein
MGLVDEYKLAKHIGKHAEIFGGLTDFRQRMKRARAFIKVLKLQDLQRGGKPLSYWFQQIYGEEL